MTASRHSKERMLFVQEPKCGADVGVIPDQGHSRIK